MGTNRTEEKEEIISRREEVTNPEATKNETEGTEASVEGKIDSDSTNSSNNDSKMSEGSVSIAHQYSEPFSLGSSSHPIIHVNLLEGDQDQIPLETLKQSLQSGGANGNGDDDDDEEMEEEIIDDPAIVAAEAAAEAGEGEGGEDEEEVEGMEEEVEELELEEELAMEEYLEEELDGDEEEEEEDLGEIPILVDFGEQSPKTDEPVIEGDFRIALPVTEKVDVVSELENLIKGSYQKKLSKKRLAAIVAKFLILQIETEISAEKSEPNLPDHPMMIDYFNLNFGKPWLMPIYLDNKQVYIPDSESEFGYQIFYEGGQRVVLDKIDQIIEARNDQNLETSQTIHDIGLNYEIDQENKLGVQGTITTDKRFDTTYQRGRDTFRYDPVLEEMAAHPPACLEKEVKIGVEGVVGEGVELDVGEIPLSLEYRRTNYQWNRKFNKYSEENSEKKKELNRFIKEGQQVTNTAVNAETINLAGFIRFPYLPRPSAYQLFLRDNPKMSQPIKGWQELPAARKIEYIKQAAELEARAKVPSRILYLDCIPELDLREELAKYGQETIILMYPRDHQKYHSLPEIKRGLLNSQKVQDSSRFVELIKTGKIIDIQTPDDLEKFLNKGQINLAEGFQMEDLFQDFNKLRKPREYLELLEKTILNTSQVISLRQLQVPNFTSLSNLDYLLRKFGLELSYLSEEDLENLAGLLQKNLAEVPSRKTSWKKLKKIFTQLSRLNRVAKGKGKEKGKGMMIPGGVQTAGEVISDKILDAREITEFYGIYPDKGKMIDSDQNRLSWIMSQADQAFLYFQVFEYYHLLDILNELRIYNKDFRGQFTMIEQNLMELLRSKGKTIQSQDWLNNKAVQTRLA